MATISGVTSDKTENRPGWYGEVEIRRYLRNLIPTSETDHKFIPTKPDIDRLDWWNPSNLGDDLPDDPDSFHADREKIVVPVETVRRLEANDQNPTEWVKRNILDKIYCRDTGDGTIRKRTIEDPYNDDQASKRLGNNHPNDPRPVYVRHPPQSDMCQLQQIWESRRSHNRDLKLLITARDAETGTGKTTLALQLAMGWDEHGWDASKATLDGQAYIDSYTDLKPGEVLVGDELEQMADSRRSMSSQNVTLTQFWSTMRAWEVSTICTLPSAAMVDKRLKELTDLRINVLRRGVGVVYETKIDDHTGEIREKRLHRIRWDPLDGNQEYERLNDKKTEHMENFAERAYHLQDEEDDNRPDPEEAVRDYRDKRVRKMYQSDYTQQEVADVFDISRSMVSRVVNDE